MPLSPKYDAAGNNLWVHSGGSTTSFARSIRPRRSRWTPANNFYITGDYTGTATFDGLSVPNTGTSGTTSFSQNITLRAPSSGCIMPAAPCPDKGYSIGVDLAGNSWVTGFAGSGPGVVFDTIALPPLGNEYIFLAKYDPAGVVQYVKQYAAGTGQDIHVLNNGTLYLNGGASQGGGNEFDNISLLYRDRGGFICQFSETAAAGIPCEDLVSFQARCQSNGSAHRLQAKLTLTDTSHSGEQVTITVDAATPFP